MTTETKILGGILIGSLAIIGAGIFLLTRGANTSGSNSVLGGSVNINYSLGEKIGSDSAKVKLVEFSDLQCPACLAAEPTVQEIIKNNKDNLQFIYRNFPLPQHKFGKLAANAAEAAGKQGKFWQMHDKLFATQTDWSVMADPTDFIVNLAKELDLDSEKIRQEIKSEAYSQKIQTDINEGNSLGVNSTPTFFINNKKVNLKSFDDLKSAVASELNSQ